MQRTIAAWRHVSTNTLALGRRLGDAEWAAPTGCPKWTVGDIFAHHVGVESWMRDGKGAPDLPVDDFTQRDVDARRDTPRTAVLDELEEVLRARAEQLETADPESIAHTAWGTRTTLATQMRHRTFDLWVHEQDVRWALHALRHGPGPAHTVTDGPAAVLVGRILLAALPKIVAKDARAPIGSAVRVSVLGGFDVTVRVGDDGRASFEEATSEAVAAPTAHVTLSRPEYVRRSAGRDLPSGPVWISGDRDLGERLVDALNVAP
ncbi:maleylpyruvate isomerase family mycothiol-dependent enzyme [Virgisporangium aliadipatigenens]|nr:maleylpyruvate isomerase family mycothiol-dependent enzyme [Virgisporangium aliadipatigenens]